jgi:branched-subunit amino acid transport protein
VTVGLIALAALMAAVTYPARALPLLALGIERLPQGALLYLRLVGPAVLAALAATNTVLIVDANRHASIHVGVEWLAVGLALLIAARWRNLFLGLLAAVVVTAAPRALGVA